MSEIIYFDTSALAKWYLNEPRSEDVERYIQEHGPVAISDIKWCGMHETADKGANASTGDSFHSPFDEAGCGVKIIIVDN